MTDKKDIDLNNIPDELKKIPNWLFHIDKKPMTWDPEKKELIPASINNPSQWLTFEQIKELKGIVEEKYKNLEKSKGIGFVFKPELGFVFIDLDHVRDDQGNVNPEVEQIIEKLDSYTEISLSGHGLHTYVRSHIPEYAKGHAKKMQKEYGNLEVYEEKFCVITGNVYKQYNKIREIEHYELFDILGIQITEKLEEEEKGNLKELSKDQIDQLYGILDQYLKEGNRNAFQLTLSVLMKNAGLSQEFVNLFFINYIKSRGSDQKMSEAEIIKSITKLNDYIFKRDYQGIAPKGFLPISVKDLKNIIWEGVKKEGPEEKKIENEFLTDSGIDREKLIDHIMESFSRIISFGKCCNLIYIWTGDKYSEEGRGIIGKFIQGLIPDLSSRSINDILDLVFYHTFKTDDEVKKMELPNRFIPVKNGLVDWKERRLYPHNPDYFYKQRLNVEYKEGVFPKKFIEYLLSRFEGNYENMFKLLEDFGLMHLRDNKYQLIPVNMGLSKDPDDPDLTSGEEGKTLTWREIIAMKYLGEGLWTDVNPSVLIDRESEWITLEGKWLHIMSLNESKRVEGFPGLIESLRDPGFTKPVKYSIYQKNIENKALHIIIGNKLPPSKDRTKAFFRSIKQFIEWKKPLEDDWKYKDMIDENEKSGMLNLGIEFLNLIELRRSVYGTETLDKVVAKYDKYSDPLIPFLQSIFEKNPDSELEEYDTIEYITKMIGETDFILPKALTKTTITKALKEAFGINTRRTSKMENGTKVNIDYYIGIKKREFDDQEIDNKNFEKNKLSNLSNDTLFLNAIRNYLSSFKIFSYSITQFNYIIYLALYRCIDTYIYTISNTNNSSEIDYINELSNRVKEFFDRLKTLENTGADLNSLITQFTQLDEMFKEYRQKKVDLEKKFSEIKYFKSELYFDQNNFEDMGVQLIEKPFSFGSYNYYALDFNTEKMDKFRFSSQFSSKSEVFTITKEEYENAKKEVGL